MRRFANKSEVEDLFNLAVRVDAGARQSARFWINPASLPERPTAEPPAWLMAATTAC